MTHRGERTLSVSELSRVEGEGALHVQVSVVVFIEGISSWGALM